MNLHSPRFDSWCSRHFTGKGFDALFIIINQDTGFDELWVRAKQWFPIPRDRKELDHWLYGEFRWGYRRLMELRGKNGEPADPGPWLLDLLREYDLERDPKSLEKYWAKIKSDEARAQERKSEEAKELAKPYARGMHREMVEGKTPHGGLIQVPRGATFCPN